MILSRVSLMSSPRIMIYLASLATILMVWVGTSRNGPGLSYDSACYLSAARGLIEGRGLLGPDASPFVDWPPLFPALMALVGFSKIDLIQAGRFVNALCLGLIVLVSGIWLEMEGCATFLVATGTAAVLVSRPLNNVTLNLRSEPAFILAILLCLLFIRRYLKTARPAFWGLALGGAIAACLTRYIGVAVVLASVTMLLADRQISLRKRLVSTTAFCILSIAPLAMWLAHNHAVSGTLMGRRQPSGYGLGELLHTILAQVAIWIFPTTRIPHVILLSGLLVLAIAVAIGRRYSRKQFTTDDFSGAILLLSFAGAYLLLLLASASQLAFDQIGQRLMAPIYVPLVLAFVLLLDRGTRRRNTVTLLGGHCSVPVLLFSIWLLASVRCYATETAYYARNGLDHYEGSRWRTSPLLSRLVRRFPDGKLYSNGSGVIFLYSGRRVSAIPTREPAGPPEGLEDRLAALRGDLSSRSSIYLAWFNVGPAELPPGFYTPGELATLLRLRMVPVASFADGVLYRLAKPSGQSAEIWK
jgi:hypothetical protein